MDAVLETLDQISGTFAHSYAIQAWAELAQAGLVDGASLAINWGDAAIVAKRDGAVIGILVWRHLGFLNQVFICLAYVSEAHRCSGVYRSMYGKLRELAHAKGATTIASGISPQNPKMIQAAEASGRKVVGLMFEGPV